MAADGDPLLDRFPRMRAATTKGSKYTRYIIDAVSDDNGGFVILGSIATNNSTAIHPDKVTLLDRFVLEDRGTVSRIPLDPTYDQYRTAAEIEALAPARAAHAARVTLVADAVVAFVAQHPEGVDLDSARTAVARELGVDKGDELLGLGVFEARNRLDRVPHHWILFTAQAPAKG
jgi:hypothetical protein